MTLVGYNDHFVSKAGHRGGFIVKNSWGAWHSHTLQYFLNEMSPINEAEVCPNSRNPRNWSPGQTVGEGGMFTLFSDPFIYFLGDGMLGNWTEIYL
jgi:hypothetical protein